MITQVRGRVWKFGDNVPTDQIVATKVVFSPMDEILRHILIELKPEFPANVRPGDLMIAGHHFGQSSGRAVAAKAIKAAGVQVVVAESFARTFLRNAFEAGLPLMEAPGAATFAKDGDVAQVDFRSGRIVNETTGAELQAPAISPFLLRMLDAGGLIELVKKTGADLAP